MQNTVYYNISYLNNYNYQVIDVDGYNYTILI